MTQRICSVDGCERNHLARGMCGPHYGNHWRENNRERDRETRLKQYVERTCCCCGTRWMTNRHAAKYCSELCYHFDRWGPRISVWPRPERQVRVAKTKVPPFCEQRDCAWCGQSFIANKQAMVNCSRDCKVKAGRSRRRGREHGSTSHFTWAEFIRLLIRFDKCCAYCQRPVDGQPEPDHVVPLSKGGSNSITNILPSCHACNADKRDLLLHEWAADRVRRGKPPVITAWGLDDVRVRHLTDALLIAS